MTITYERCSCGARDKYKCSKENGLGCGKMCLKECIPIPAELFERMDAIKKKAEENRLREQTIEQRMQSIEDQLKEIRKELEDGLARYKSSEKSVTVPQFIPMTQGQFREMIDRLWEDSR